MVTVDTYRVIGLAILVHPTFRGERAGPTHVELTTAHLAQHLDEVLALKHGDRVT